MAGFVVVSFLWLTVLNDFSRTFVFVPGVTFGSQWWFPIFVISFYLFCTFGAEYALKDFDKGVNLGYWPAFHNTMVFFYSAFLVIGTLYSVLEILMVC